MADVRDRPEPGGNRGNAGRPPGGGDTHRSSPGRGRPGGRVHRAAVADHRAAPAGPAAVPGSASATRPGRRPPNERGQRPGRVVPAEPRRAVRAGRRRDAWIVSGRIVVRGDQPGARRCGPRPGGPRPGGQPRWPAPRRPATGSPGRATTAPRWRRPRTDGRRQPRRRAASTLAPNRAARPPPGASPVRRGAGRSAIVRCSTVRPASLDARVRPDRGATTSERVLVTPAGRSGRAVPGQSAAGAGRSPLRRPIAPPPDNRPDRGSSVRRPSGCGRAGPPARPWVDRRPAQGPGPVGRAYPVPPPPRPDLFDAERGAGRRTTPGGGGLRRPPRRHAGCSSCPSVARRSRSSSSTRRACGSRSSRSRAARSPRSPGFDGHQGIALVGRAAALRRRRRHPRPRRSSGASRRSSSSSTRSRTPRTSARCSAAPRRRASTASSSRRITRRRSARRRSRRRPARSSTSCWRRSTTSPGALADLHVRGLRIVGADADAALTVRAGRPARPVRARRRQRGPGSEPAVRRRCDLLVRIPMRGAIGSLNASVAGSILLFEAPPSGEAPPRPPPGNGAGPVRGRDEPEVQVEHFRDGAAAETPAAKSPSREEARGQTALCHEAARSATKAPCREGQTCQATGCEAAVSHEAGGREAAAAKPPAAKGTAAAGPPPSPGPPRRPPRRRRQEAPRRGGPRRRDRAGAQ